MNNKKVYKIVLVALFAALCYVGTMIHIPLPSGGMIHLGNFFCILAALLCGGLVGGFAGGIGCGLYDLIIYSDPVGFVQYFILKFIMGFLVGSLFRIVLNKKLNYSLILSVLSVCLILFTSLVIVGYKTGNFKLSSSITNKDLYITIVTVIGYLFSLCIMIAAVFSLKLKKQYKELLFVCGLSVLVNIFLEFIAKIFVNLTINSLTMDAALIKGFSSLPSCILTGGVTVGFICIIYPKLFAATKNINFINDINESDLNE